MHLPHLKTRSRVISGLLVVRWFTTIYEKRTLKLSPKMIRLRVVSSQRMCALQGVDVSPKDSRSNNIVLSLRRYAILIRQVR